MNEYCIVKPIIDAIDQKASNAGTDMNNNPVYSRKNAKIVDWKGGRKHFGTIVFKLSLEYCINNIDWMVVPHRSKPSGEADLMPLVPKSWGKGLSIYVWAIQVKRAAVLAGCGLVDAVNVDLPGRGSNMGHLEPFCGAMTATWAGRRIG